MFSFTCSLPLSSISHSLPPFLPLILSLHSSLLSFFFFSVPSFSLSILFVSLTICFSLLLPFSLSLSLSLSSPLSLLFPIGTSVWYYNPPPGRILPNNTAISVFTDVAEIRCYTGDNTTNNNATEIKKPMGSSPTLSFSNTEPGFLKKNGLTPISGVANGVYTCQYTDSSGSVSYTSFAIFPRSREPSSGSSNTSKLLCGT